MSPVLAATCGAIALPVALVMLGDGYHSGGWLGSMLLGGLIGMLAGRISQLQDRLGRLEERLKSEQRRADAAMRAPEVNARAAGAPAAGAPAANASDASAAEAPALPTSMSMPMPAETRDSTPVPTAIPPSTSAAPPAPTAASVATPSVATPSAVSAQPRRSMRPPPPPSVFDRDGAIGRWLFGGNVIAKVGIAVLFLGLSFLAKYAKDAGLLPPELRVAGIGTVAVVLLAIGWRLRDRRPQYAQVLQGGAVAALYLTMYSAFRFYGMIPAGMAFVLLASVSMLSAALAVLQRAQALAIIGLVGGFAVPVLVSSGSGNHVALFSYLLLIDIGVLAMLSRMAWPAVASVAFAGSFGIAILWGTRSYHDALLWSCEAFLLAALLVFLAMQFMLMRGKHAPGATSDTVNRWVNGSLLFGLPTIVMAIQYHLVHEIPHAMGVSSLALAAVYVAAAMLLRRQLSGPSDLPSSDLRSSDTLRLAFEGMLAVATVLLALVVPFAFSARATAGAWALEGAGLVWLGLRQQRLSTRVFGYMLLLLAPFALVHGALFTPVQTVDLRLPLALGAIASLFAAFQSHRAAVRGAAVRGSAGGTATSAAHEPWANAVFSWLGAGWLVLFGASWWSMVDDNRDLYPAYLSTLAFVALVLATLGRRLSWPTVSTPAFALPFALFPAVLYAGIALGSPMHDRGWIGWILAAFAYLLVLRWSAPAWDRRASAIMHFLVVMLVAAVGAMTGRHLTSALAHGPEWQDYLNQGLTPPLSGWESLGWILVPMALVALYARAGIESKWPVRDQVAVHRQHAPTVLSLALLAWALYANFLSDGGVPQLPYVPLLNPLDLGIAASLLAITFWSRSTGQRNARDFWPRALALTAFLFVNGMMLRGFTHYANVPFHPSAWMSTSSVQTGLSLLWTITALALMGYAAHRARKLPSLADSARSMWTVGAVLLGVVVAKLLLVDQSDSGTITRIVSFIGVGVLMLVIGYVAPRPESAAASPHTDDPTPSHSEEART